MPTQKLKEFGMSDEGIRLFEEMSAAHNKFGWKMEMQSEAPYTELELRLLKLDFAKLSITSSESGLTFTGKDAQVKIPYQFEHLSKAPYLIPMIKSGDDPSVYKIRVSHGNDTTHEINLKLVDDGIMAFIIDIKNKLTIQVGYVSYADQSELKQKIGNSPKSKM